jgi:hypothetical protein
MLENGRWDLIRRLKGSKRKKPKKERKIKKNIQSKYKIPTISSSHEDSNGKGTKSVFHHFCPGLPVSLTFCPIR